jgi:hypothetical protein
MTTTIIVAVVLGWVLFSGALVVFLCMNSSRLSEAEELPRDRRLRKPAYRRARQSESAGSLPAGSSVAKSGGH